MEHKENEKPNQGRTTILEEIALLHEKIKDLEKDIENVWNYFGWRLSFLTELEKVVGVDNTLDEEERTSS